jgi:lipoyl(octanoyl) transferase
MRFWEGIVPCGLDGVRMAAMADFIVPAPAVEAVGRAAAELFGQVFEFEMEWEIARGI